MRTATDTHFRPCSPCVSGRRPLGKDEALDYDVMSDEDWESEPEGEDVDMVRPCHLPLLTLRVSRNILA